MGRSSTSLWQWMQTLFGEKTKKQIIFESRNSGGTPLCKLWHGLFGNRRVVLFVDNEGTKFSLEAAFWQRLCRCNGRRVAKLECQLHTTMWIARVPSKSNIADPPSRGITDIPLLVGAEDVTMLAK